MLEIKTWIRTENRFVGRRIIPRGSSGGKIICDLQNVVPLESEHFCISTSVIVLFEGGLTELEGVAPFAVRRRCRECSIT